MAKDIVIEGDVSSSTLSEVGYSLHYWFVSNLKHILLKEPLAIETFQHLKALNLYVENNHTTLKQHSTTKAYLNSWFKKEHQFPEVSRIQVKLLHRIMKKQKADTSVFKAQSTQPLLEESWSVVSRIAWDDPLFRANFKHILYEYLSERVLLPNDFNFDNVLPKTQMLWCMIELLPSESRWVLPEQHKAPPDNVSISFWEYWLAAELFRQSFQINKQNASFLEKTIRTGIAFIQKKIFSPKQIKKIKTKRLRRHAKKHFLSNSRSLMLLKNNPIFLYPQFHHEKNLIDDFIALSLTQEHYQSLDTPQNMLMYLNQLPKSHI